jgi:hypothetical protein
MSNITIYQSTTDLNDPELETLVSDCQNIISRGKRAAVELCIKMAETDDYLNTLKKKDKKAKVSMIIETLEIKSVTFYKYAGVGRYVKANPALQDLSMDAIIAHMKPQRQAKARSTYAHTINDEARQAELLKWEAFAHWLSAQMPADQFDKVYNRFCAQYRA